MKKIPSTFTIVFILVIFAAFLTWFIPAGTFMRTSQEVNGNLKEIVLPDSYHLVEKQPQTWEIFAAFFKGFVDKADIIVFILMVGGAFWILNSTKAIDMGIHAFLKIIQRFQHIRWLNFLGINNLIIIFIMLMFSLFGAVFGMSEETIAFIIIFVPLAISMGYDSITGVCLCYLAAHVGFAGAMLNPFTIGIAQGIAGLPLFSGLGYRAFCWVILTIVGIAFVLWYANRVKKRPELSPTYQLDDYWRKRVAEQNMEKTAYHTPNSAWVVWIFLTLVMACFAVLYPFTQLSIGSKSISVCLLPVLAGLFFITGWIALRKSVHFFILNILIFTILFLVTGVLGYGWYVEEIASLFFAMGIFAGLSYAYRFDQLLKMFLDGVKDILNPALVVGLASGIIFILKDGQILDTILYGLTYSLGHLGEIASVGVMYVFQTGLNLVMPSGSAKAALTMPIMTQFADLIHLSRQTTVLAFQFGDGFTNMITPTSGVLLGCLGVARIPYTTWIKWIYKFILGLILIGFLLILVTLFIPLEGF